MGTCANCGRTLEPGWKFCIHCGTPIAKSTATTSTSGQSTTTKPAAPSVASAIPGAIRASDEGDDELPPAKKRDVALIVGVALGVGGLVLIIIVAVAVFSPR